MKKTKKIKVNLGCGTHIMPGKEWINVDNYILANTPNFVQSDVRHLPFDSESVDYIVCDQVLEHIPMKDISLVLFEIRRILKKGGKATIIVPDFESAARDWLSYNHNENFSPMVYNYLSEVVYGNQLHEGEFHKTPMSAGFLNYNLNMVGLVEHTIIFYPANHPIPDFEGVRPSPEGALCRNAQLVSLITK